MLKCLNLPTKISLTKLGSRINSSGKRYVKTPTNGALPRYSLIKIEKIQNEIRLKYAFLFSGSFSRHFWFSPSKCDNCIHFQLHQYTRLKFCLQIENLPIDLILIIDKVLQINGWFGECSNERCRLWSDNTTISPIIKMPSQIVIKNYHRCQNSAQNIEKHCIDELLSLDDHLNATVKRRMTRNAVRLKSSSVAFQRNVNDDKKNFVVLINKM